MNGHSNENTLAVGQGATSTGSPPLTGIGACIFQLALLALLAAPIMYAQPRWDMLLTGSLWFAFSIYWSIAG